MNTPFRVCIYGRFYDIPTNDISKQTLDKLKKITDDNGNVNPKDLLVVFLESSEETIKLQNIIKCAEDKISLHKSQ